MIHNSSLGFSVGSFFLTNGEVSLEGVVLFTIKHRDRVPPTLHHNKWLPLPDASMETITCEHLQLTDPDTAPNNLTFIVTQLPRHGKLLLRGVAMTMPAIFTQRDVDEMGLAYQHDPDSLEEVDRFYFLPSDGSNRGFLEFGQLRENEAIFTIQVRLTKVLT